MDQQVSSAGGAPNHTSVERRGDRELVVRRLFNAPPSTVFRAWSQPELFQRWWVPKSASGVSLVSCDMDVRTGGKYRLEFGAGIGHHGFLRQVSRGGAGRAHHLD